MNIKNASSALDLISEFLMTKMLFFTIRFNIITNEGRISNPKINLRIQPKN